MIRTFQALHEVDPGFRDPDHVQTFRVSIPEAAIKNPRGSGSRVSDDVRSNRRRFRASLPCRSPASRRWTIRAGTTCCTRRTGVRRDADSAYPDLSIYYLPGCRRPWETRWWRGTISLGRRLRKAPGGDCEREPGARIVETTAAALGKRVREASKSSWREVVGVVHDQRDDGVRQEAPTTCLPAVAQENFGTAPGEVMRPRVSWCAHTRAAARRVS